MSQKIRVVHYLNQFFAQIGGEDKGDVGPTVKAGVIGAGRALQQALGDRRRSRRDDFLRRQFFRRASRASDQ